MGLATKTPSASCQSDVGHTGQPPSRSEWNGASEWGCRGITAEGS